VSWLGCSLRWTRRLPARILSSCRTPSRRAALALNGQLAGLDALARPKRTARAAVRAYRTAEIGITAAASPGDVETAIRGFVQAVNALPGIETTGREDAGEAVAQLAGRAPMPIDADLAQAWFDAERDF
jgi:hypothetical protein